MYYSSLWLRCHQYTRPLWDHVLSCYIFFIGSISAVTDKNTKHIIRNTYNKDSSNADNEDSSNAKQVWWSGEQMATQTDQVSLHESRKSPVILMVISRGKHNYIFDTERKKKLFNYLFDQNTLPIWWWGFAT